MDALMGTPPCDYLSDLDIKELLASFDRTPIQEENCALGVQYMRALCGVFEKDGKTVIENVMYWMSSRGKSVSLDTSYMLNRLIKIRNTCRRKDNRYLVNLYVI